VSGVSINNHAPSHRVLCARMAVPHTTKAPDSVCRAALDYFVALSCCMQRGMQAGGHGPQDDADLLLSVSRCSVELLKHHSISTAVVKQSTHFT
jgi:hypothetical protein